MGVLAEGHPVLRIVVERVRKLMDVCRVNDRSSRHGVDPISRQSACVVIRSCDIEAKSPSASGLTGVIWSLKHRVPGDLVVGRHIETDEAVESIAFSRLKVFRDQNLPGCRSKVRIPTGSSEFGIDDNEPRHRSMRGWLARICSSRPEPLSLQMMKWHSHIETLSSAMLHDAGKRLELKCQLRSQELAVPIDLTPFGHFQNHEQQQGLVRRVAPRLVELCQFAKSVFVRHRSLPSERTIPHRNRSHSQRGKSCLQKLLPFTPLFTPIDQHCQRSQALLMDLSTA